MRSVIQHVAMRRRLLVCVGALFIAAMNMPGAQASDEPATLGFTVSPDSGPPGTLVHFEGDVPVDAPDFDVYQQPNSAYGLLGPFDVTLPKGWDCDLVVEMDDVTKTITDEGHVTGSFRVGREGSCFMSPTDLGPQRPLPGVYHIALSCHACPLIGTFHITAAEPLARTGRASTPLAALGVGLVAIGLCCIAISRRQALRCTGVSRLR